LRWLEETLTKAKEQGEIITEYEWEFARGCDKKVIIKWYYHEYIMDIILVYHHCF